MTSAPTRKLKVLLTVHCFFPRHYHGTERYTLDLAKCLQSFGHEVVVVTVNRYDEDVTHREWHEYEFEGVRVLSVDITHHYPEGIVHTYFAPHYDDVYRRILHQERPDMVHCCHLLYVGVNFITVAREFGLPVILSLTDFFGICWTNTLTTIGGTPCLGPDRFSTNCVRDFYSSRPRVTNSEWINRFFRFCRHVLPAYGFFQLWANTGRLGAQKLRPPVADIQDRRGIIQKHFALADEYFVATEIVHEAFLRQNYEAAKFRKLTFGIQQPDPADQPAFRQRYVDLETPGARPFIIGFVGQVARHKGILDLLAAFQSAELENAELHVYGDLGQDPRAGPRTREAAANNPAIKLLGTFPGADIYRVLASIHVLVIPSTWHENAPLILLNALASRTILLVSNGKGLVEFVQSGGNGFVFPMGDVAALTERLRELGRTRGELREWFDRLSPYDRSPAGYAREIEAAYFRRVKPAGEIAFPAPPPETSRPLVFRKISGDIPAASEFLPLHDDRFYLTSPLSEPRHLALARDRTGLELDGLPGYGRAKTLRLTAVFHQAGTNTFLFAESTDPEKYGQRGRIQRLNESGTYEITISRDAFPGSTNMLRWHPASRVPDAKLTLVNIDLLDEKGLPVLPGEGHELLPRIDPEEWLRLSSSPVAFDPRFYGALVAVPPQSLLEGPGPARSRRDCLVKGADFLATVDAFCGSPTAASNSVLEISFGPPLISRLLRGPNVAVAVENSAAREWAARELPDAAVSGLDPGASPFDGTGPGRDRVIALHVLHYLPFEKWGEYVAAFGRATAPGGQLVLSIPSYRSIGKANRGQDLAIDFILAGETLRKAEQAMAKDRAITLYREKDGLPPHLPIYTIAPLPPFQDLLPDSLELVRYEFGGLEHTHCLLLLRRKESGS